MTTDVDIELGALLSARATDLADQLAVSPDLLSTVQSAHRRHRRNRIAGSALSVVAVAAGAGVGVTAATGEHHTSTVTTPSLGQRSVAYHNARFGFSDRIPSQLKAWEPPADGDGQTWQSTDGAAKVTVSAVNNNNGLTANRDLNLLGDHYGKLGAGGGIESFKKAGLVVVKEQNKDTYFYQRDVVMSNVIYSLVWAYPLADAKTYGRMVSSTVHWFKAGPNRAA